MKNAQWSLPFLHPFLSNLGFNPTFFMEFRAIEIFIICDNDPQFIVADLNMIH